jgi:hypothetical protein
VLSTLQTEKVSEGQQQWWSFKAAHFDSVLLFKMGKFYEVGGTKRCIGGMSSYHVGLLYGVQML